MQNRKKVGFVNLYIVLRPIQEFVTQKDTSPTLAEVPQISTSVWRL